MTADHLWIIEVPGQPSPLVTFLRSCHSIYRGDDPGWSPSAFCASATWGFESLVIAECATVHQVVELAQLFQRHAERLRNAPKRLVVIAIIPPPCAPAILAAAGFTIQHTDANAVREHGGLHVVT